MRISRRRCAICITRRAARTPSWSRRLFACRPRLRTNWASRPQDVPRCPRTSPGLMTRIARKRGDFGEQVVCTGSALAAERDVSGDVLSTFSAYSVNLLRGTSWRTCREAFEGLLAMALRAPGNGLGRAIGRWVGWGRAGELGLRAGSAGPGRCRAAQAGRRWLAVSARAEHASRTDARSTRRGPRASSLVVLPGAGRVVARDDSGRARMRGLVFARESSGCGATAWGRFGAAVQPSCCSDPAGDDR